METALAALKSALRHGADHLALTFFGGEPLLQADNLFQILTAARRLERSTRVFTTAKVSTNGLLLTKDIVDRAGELGLFLSLSCDGVAEAQDACRVTAGGQGSSAQVEKALDLLVAAKRPFSVYSVVTPQTAARLAESTEYLWSRGARILIQAIDYAAPWTPYDLAELRRQFQAMGAFYERKLAEDANFHLEPFDSRIAQVTRSGDYQSCSPGNRQITVAPDGTLYGCVEMFHRRIKPLGDAWKWIAAPSTPGAGAGSCGHHDASSLPAECQSCGVNDRCNNHCECVNLRGTGKAGIPPEILCQTEQDLIQLSDTVARRLYKRKNGEFLRRHYSQSYHLLSSVERWIETMEPFQV